MIEDVSVLQVSHLVGCGGGQSFISSFKQVGGGPSPMEKLVCSAEGIRI